MENNKDYNFDIPESDTQAEDTSVLNAYSNGSFTDMNPNIPKDNAPIVVLVGPPQSGKSMVLKCLADYLRNHETKCTVEANRNLFDHPKYQENCDIFEELIGNVNEKMPNTVNYLMADIIDQTGETMAHFLEAPGEHYFSLNKPEEEPKRDFRGYMNSIARIDNKHLRKVVYIIILDLDSDTSLRRSPKLLEKYRQKMEKLYGKYVQNFPAKVILLYNKADIPHDGKWANAGGVKNIAALKKDAQEHYGRLFFTRKFLFWDISDVQFVPFCTGMYSGKQYDPPTSSYPENLWNAIKKSW